MSSRVNEKTVESFEEKRSAKRSHLGSRKLASVHVRGGPFIFHDQMGVDPGYFRLRYPVTVSLPVGVLVLEACVVVSWRQVYRM